jgi:putative tricarboxylic transport membrane protein
MVRLSGTLAATFAVIGTIALAGPVCAQGWKPERNVELTIPSGAGGSNDIFGRVIHKVWTDLKLVPVSTSLVNRAAAEHVVAYTYVSQHPGDPYCVGVVSTPMVVNPVEGRTTLTHNDITPIAYMVTEPMIVVVRADSPLKNGQSMIDALKKDPGSLTIALTSTGHRVSIGMPLLKAGVPLKSLKMPAFKGGGELTTQVLGGHVDLLVTSVSTSVAQITSGKMRGIAVSSTRRLSGPMAGVPTWQEMGYQSSGSWKGFMGPKNLTPAQIAFWEDVMHKVTQSEEIKKYAEENQWIVEFKGAAEFKK